jgi:acetyltransferase-like isoleucine patch superfamily enzyme
MYSYGECFTPGAFPPGTIVGRYVSVADGVRAFSRNHPMRRLSLHPFFYNSALGYVPKDTIGSGSLEIGHDSWLGERAIITPGCRRVGIGAVVGAGAVVTRDVPNFAIVAGNPARLIIMRFADDLCDRILLSRWWELPISQIRPYLSDMAADLMNAADHPLLSEATSAA